MARRPRAQSSKSRNDLTAPLAAFVVLFVFALGFGIYAFVELSDAQARIYDSYQREGRDVSIYEKLDKEGEAYVGYIAQLEQKDKTVATLRIENQQLTKIIGRSDIGTIEDDLKELRARLESIVELQDEASLVELARRITIEKESLGERLEAAQEKLKEFDTRLAASDAEKVQTTRELNSKIEDLERQMAAKNQQIRDLREEMGGTISKLQNRIVELTQINESDRDKYKVELRNLRQELLMKSEALVKVQTEKIGGTEFSIDTADVDGIVLNVSEFGKSCSVDIGLRDGAKVGMQFVVYETGPAGKRREKATIELMKVNEHYSFAGIASLRDELDPVLKNDIVISPVFKRGQSTVFVLENDIDEVDRRVLTSRIGQLGSRVVEQVTPETDFVVIKDTPGDQAHEANKWAVRVIRLKDVSKVLGMD